MSTTIPKLYLRLAAMLSALFIIGHVAGLRRSTAIISGTLPSTEVELFFGVLYVLCWFAFVLVAPVLALAGGIQLLMSWLASKVTSAERACPEKEGRVVKVGTSLPSRST